MNDAKITVKKALSLALVVVLIVAVLFGLDVPYDLDDVVQETEETTQTDIVASENASEESTTPVLPDEDKADTPTDEVETQLPQETAPTDDVDTAEPSETGEVAHPSETTTDATEGDVQNA